MQYHKIRDKELWNINDVGRCALCCQPVDHDDKRIILVQGGEGSAEIVRLQHRALHRFLRQRRKCHTFAARPIPSSSPIRPDLVFATHRSMIQLSVGRTAYGEGEDFGKFFRRYMFDRLGLKNIGDDPTMSPPGILCSRNGAAIGGAVVFTRSVNLIRLRFRGRRFRLRWWLRRRLGL